VLLQMLLTMRDPRSPLTSFTTPSSIPPGWSLYMMCMTRIGSPDPLSCRTTSGSSACASRDPFAAARGIVTL
jgi:hypothetical protein